MTKERLKKYANLIANVGARVKKGQEVMIFAELDQPEFVKILTDWETVVLAVSFIMQRFKAFGCYPIVPLRLDCSSILSYL